MESKFNKDIYLVDIAPKGDTAYIRKSANTTSDIVDTIKKSATNKWLATGYYLTETTGNLYWLLLRDKNNNKNYAYARNDVIITNPGNKAVTPVKEVSKEDAQTLINNLVKSDQEIYKRLIILSPMINSLKQKGVNVSNQETVLKALILRYEKRQKKLKESTSVKIQNYTTGLINYVKDNWKTWLGLGELTTLTLAIGAVICIGAGMVIYNAFQPVYDESKADLKITGEFKDFLEKLPKDKQEAIKTDLEKQIDDAYNAGKKNQWWTSNWKWIKNALLITAGGVVGIVLLPKLIDKITTKNNG